MVRVKKMKYFCNIDEKDGSCYLEFHRGTDNKTWSEKSLIIEDEVSGSIGLTKIIQEVIPSFDPYGAPVTVDKDQWSKIKALAEENCICREALQEAESWFEETFSDCESFMILGI